MSSVNRFISASAASWAKILLTVASQVLLVPVFLSHWSVAEYGCWLIIQTIVGYATIISSGHQIFVGFEFLKIGDKQPEKLRHLFYSAIPWVILIALLELLAVVVLIAVGYMATVFNPDHTLSDELLRQAFWALILYSVAMLLGNSAGGLAGRAVVVYGVYPRMAWWGTLLSVMQAVTSGVAVVLGANLLTAVTWVVIATILVNVPIHVDMWRVFRRNDIFPVKPDWRLGFRNFCHSMAVVSSLILDISRNQGVRIFLGAIIGVTRMTAFSTMRTLSNLSLQGIGTITNPIMPEVMRFLRERDSERTNATVGFVWFFAVILLAPVLIVFQFIMPVVFVAWTRGKIAFDPALFGLFSLGLLVYSLARPSVAVLQGNNLLRVQLFISVVNTVLAIAGIFIFTPVYGVAGAGAALLVSETVGTALSIFFAIKWLHANGLIFPRRLFATALGSILSTAFAITAIVWTPLYKWWILIAGLLISCAISVVFLRQLPAVVRNRMRGMLRRFI